MAHRPAADKKEIPVCHREEKIPQNCPYNFLYSQNVYEVCMDPALAFKAPRVECCLKVIKKYGLHSERLLDIGYGDGQITRAIAQAIGAKEVHGVDINCQQPKSASQKDIVTHQMDIERQELPFPEEHFDFIFCGEVIEHIYNTDAFLSEVYRVLSKDGFLLLTTPNMAAWYNRILLAFGFQPMFTEVSLWGLHGIPRSLRRGPAVGHIHVFTLGSLKSLLSECKYECIYERGAPMVSLPLLKTFDSFISLKKSLASILIVLAKRKTNVEESQDDV